MLISTPLSALGVLPFAVDREGAAPPIHCSRLSLKTQATGADDAQCTMDGHLRGAWRRFSRHDTWIEYEAPMAESCCSACSRVFDE